jgi:hypothetical protein
VGAEVTDVSPEQELRESLEPLAWCEFVSTYPLAYTRKYSPLTVEARCMVVPSPGVLSAKTDTAIRFGLLSSAEEIIATVKRLGWTNVRAPRIEFDGVVCRGLPHEVFTQHACEVRLDIMHAPARKAAKARWGEPT